MRSHDSWPYIDETFPPPKCAPDHTNLAMVACNGWVRRKVTSVLRETKVGSVHFSVGSCSNPINIAAAGIIHNFRTEFLRVVARRADEKFNIKQYRKTYKYKKFSNVEGGRKPTLPF